MHEAEGDERNEQQGWSQWVPQPKGQLVSGIAAIFYVLVYPAPWSVLPANAVLNATACLCLYLLLARLTKDTNAAVAAAAPFALFPSNLLWNAQFHNDNYAVPGVIFILLGWLMVLQDDPSRTATRVVRAVAACTLIGVGSLLLGLVHARATAWEPDAFGPDAVPAKVAATFARGGRNLQAIR